MLGDSERQQVHSDELGYDGHHARLPAVHHRLPRTNAKRRARTIASRMIAKVVPPASERPDQARTVERLGPYESRSIAAEAREVAVGRYRGRPDARIEIVCDFT